jgi:hypothetical protein
MSTRGYKQSGGYFTIIRDMNTTVALAGANPTALSANFGTDSAPLFSTNSLSISSIASTLLNTGNVLKDMGKTLVSSGRIFRKVQLVQASLGGVGGVTQSGPGVGPNPDYFTGYVELPSIDSSVGAAGGGASGANATVANRTFVARLG